MDIFAMVQDMLTPELMVLIPVLYFVGSLLKNFQTIDNRFIPLILGGVSIVLCGLYVFATTVVSTPQEIASAILTVIIQGILFAGTSVYANQVVKQSSTKG